MLGKPHWKNIVLYLHAVNVTQHVVVCTLAFAHAILETALLLTYVLASVLCCCPFKN